MQSLFSIRFLAPFVAVLLALVAILVEYITLSQRLEAREFVSAQKNLQSLALQTQSTVDRELRHGNFELLNQIIAQLNFHPLMTRAILVGDNDKILVSTQKLYQGLLLNELDLKFNNEFLDGVRKNQTGIVYSGLKPFTLRAVYPVSIPPEDHADALRSTLGLLIIDFDYNDNVNAMQREILSATFQSAGSIVALVFLIGIAVHFGITRRVLRVIEAADKYLQGDVSKRVGLSGQDEIGLIGKAFDQVADSAEASKEAIRELNKTLELRVEARTTELHASRKELRAILDTAADAVIAITDDTTVVEFNPAAERMFGWLKSDIVGKNVKVLMPENIAQHHDDYVLNFKKSNTPRVIGQDREITGLRSDGSEFPFEITINTTTLNDKNLFIAVGRDVTERKQAEADLFETRQALLKAENMAALGNLVAGVAHEINTPVGVGVTAASHLKEITESFERNYREGSMRRSDLDDFIKNTIQTAGILENNLFRASELIRSFKQVAVDQAGGEERDVDLAEYVDEILLSLRPKLKNRAINIVKQIPIDIAVRLKAGAFSQILTNLIANSLHHGFTDNQAGTITIAAQYSNNQLELEYKDDGVGMDEQTAKRIFEPFFTTKRGSGGSGLGMHIVFNLVTNALGGKIRCQSELGQGTIFSISFPIDQQDIRKTHIILDEIS